MRAICDKGAAGLARLRGAVADGSLPIAGSGSGRLVVAAARLRSAATMAIAFVGVRRASDVARVCGGYVRVDMKVGVVDLGVKRRKNGQVGADQPTHVIAMDSWCAACPVHLPSGLLWSRSWLGKSRDSVGRMPGPEGARPLFAGFVRARFGLIMAASGITATWRMSLEGRGLSPREGGARLYLMNGMSCEATQELGCWEPLDPWKARIA